MYEVIIFMHKERRDQFNTHVKCGKFRVRINIHICNIYALPKLRYERLNNVY